MDESVDSQVAAVDNSAPSIGCRRAMREPACWLSMPSDFARFQAHAPAAVACLITVPASHRLFIYG
ncbi:hypothetical protein CXK92_12040 [Stutzerimonas stutzeri]|uniref:Uncharacterized protein n=1 Tax=Stutzerimonas stutzeri TaxID=316 RepID=A0A2N8S2S7_STUST|nr:hypothetical protein CXK92_12040 [Stutzerimonas stutzeri]